MMQKGLQSQKALPPYVQQLAAKQKLGNPVEYYQEDLLTYLLLSMLKTAVATVVLTCVPLLYLYGLHILSPIGILCIPAILFILFASPAFFRRHPRVAAYTNGLIQFTMNQEYQFCHWEDIETLYSNRFDGSANMRLLLRSGEEISVNSRLLRYSKEPISIGLADLIEQKFIALYIQDVVNRYWSGQLLYFGNLTIRQQGIANKRITNSFVYWNLIKIIAVKYTDSESTNIALTVTRIDAGLFSGRLDFDVTPFPNFPVFVHLLTDSIKFPIKLDVKQKI